MQIAQRRKDFQHVRDRFGDGQLVALATFERLPTDVLHDDVTDGFAVLVGVLDEVEDLHDRGVHHLGEEPPLGHRDRLGLGVTGMHQTLEHHRAIVDVAVERQIHPAQPAVRDAALDFVLAGDDVTRIQLRQERIRASAVRAPALRLRPCLPCWIGPTGRPQFQQNRLDSGTTGLGINASSGSMSGTRGISTSPPPSRRTGARVADFIRSCGSVSAMCSGDVVAVIVEIGPEDRLGGHRAALRGRIHHRVGGLGTRTDVVRVLAFRVHRLLGHQSTYLGLGGAGAGPSTVNHLRYKAFQVPSRRMRSRVPLTKRTSPVLSSLTPMP